MKYVVEINQQTLTDKHKHKHTSFLHEQYESLKVKQILSIKAGYLLVLNRKCFNLHKIHKFIKIFILYAQTIEC